MSVSFVGNAKVTKLGGDLYTFRSQIGVTDGFFCPNVTQSDAECSCCCFSVVKRAEVEMSGQTAGLMSKNCEEVHLQPTRGPQQPHIKRSSSAVMYEGPARDLSQGRMKGGAEASAKQRLMGANRTGQARPSNWRDLYQPTSAEDTIWVDGYQVLGKYIMKNKSANTLSR